MEDSTKNPLMKEMHWYGVDDRTILPIWTRNYCQHFGSSCLAIDAEHATGWLDHWKTLLKRSREIFMSGPDEAVLKQQ